MCECILFILFLKRWWIVHGCNSIWYKTLHWNWFFQFLNKFLFVALKADIMSLLINTPSPLPWQERSHYWSVCGLCSKSCFSCFPYAIIHSSLFVSPSATYTNGIFLGFFISSINWKTVTLATSYFHVSKQSFSANCVRSQYICM